jgi:hypothetical protein
MSAPGAEVGRSASLVSVADELGQFRWRWWSRSMSGMGNALAMMGSVAAGHVRFHWRS